MKKLIFLISIVFLFTSNVVSQESTGYMLPPDEIVDLVDAPSTPSMELSPLNDKVLFIENPGLKALSDLAVEERRIAGTRIDPATNGPSRAGYGIGLTISDIYGNNIKNIANMPENPRIRNVRWSADGSYIAFTNTVEDGIELWVVDVDEYAAEKLTGPIVNDVMGNAYSWLPDNTIIYSSVIQDRGDAPQRPMVADAPVIQESSGRKAAVRTYQDLMADKIDEEMFDYYATSQLYKTDPDANSYKVGKPGVIWYYNISPDGNYVLVNTINKPYSYIVPYYRFPQTIEIWEADGNLVRLVANIPVADNIPQGFDAVREGPRALNWRSDKPATLFWVEAIDGGDPSTDAEHRDQLFFIEAPFKDEVNESIKLKLRYSGVMWGRDDFAIINEYWRKDRRYITSSFNPGSQSSAMTKIFDYSREDSYNNPGRFQQTKNEYGRSVLMFDDTSRSLYLIGRGASPEGNMPFVDSYDLRTAKTERLWQCEAPYYEYPVKIIDEENGLIITRRESQLVHPNYYLRNIYDDSLVKITDLPDPFPQLRNIKKEMIHYERKDGVPLSGTLYLPEGFEPGVDEPLPTILWAYPREFKSSDAAGQVRGSKYTYTRIGATSPVMLVTQGYAVLDNASFPIIGEGDEEPNNTFVEQLVANAQGAIDELVEMGVTDPDRVGVSGHSYGAFMTANLLTHSDLFAAGVARSGAYNRSLTPFGFQAEERTYWQAPEIYHQMSPFSHADKVKTPILLIHGAADNNSGTYPLQSERYYDALRGHGAIVRLLMLPHESHGYRARESILHMHWEWVEWFNKYLKQTN